VTGDDDVHNLDVDYDDDDDDDLLFSDTPETAPAWERRDSTAAANPAAPAKRARRRIDNVDRHTYRVLRDRFRRTCQAVGEPCWICEQNGDPAEIDYGLAYPDPLSWSLDHLEPVEISPEKALEPTLFRASHLVCNKRRGLAERLGRGRGEAAPEPVDTGEPSECWCDPPRCVCAADGRLNPLITVSG
jgi:hypothetical protein